MSAIGSGISSGFYPKFFKVAQPELVDASQISSSCGPGGAQPEIDPRQLLLCLIPQEAYHL